MLACINAHPSKGGFVIVANANAAAVTTGTEYNAAFNGLGLSTVAITQDTDLTPTYIAGTSGGTSLFSSYGAGALSTEVAPQYRQKTNGTEVVTEILVDLTGLACKGDAANDVIGLAAGGAAYIGKYVQSTMGTLYKVEVMCLEVPGQGTATITTDIDINFNSSASLAYDGAAGTSEVNTGGFAAVGAGAIVANTAGAAVPADYIYLVEGDTAATTGVYNAGKLLIKLYGSTLSF
jgi:hypothetical protein